jgi:hypothetical protein
MTQLNRSSISILAACLSVSALCGCDELGIGEAPRTTIALIDRSGSINPEDLSIYQESLNAIGADLDSGDRFVVANIGDSTRSEFRPEFDLQVPESDKRIEREAAVRTAHARLNAALPELLPGEDRPPSSATRILDAIAAASQAYGPAPHEGARLLLLSDGVEESAVANLAKIEGVGEIVGVIEEVRSAGLLPDLRGVEISVIGAGGANYPAVRAFWTAYANATGAKLVNYGRLPFRAEPQS